MSSLPGDKGKEKGFLNSTVVLGRLGKPLRRGIFSEKKEIIPKTAERGFIKEKEGIESFHWKEVDPDNRGIIRRSHTSLGTAQYGWRPRLEKHPVPA